MIKAVIFDLDGTLYIGKKAIPGAEKKVKELRSKGVKTLFLTNAATRSRKGVAEKLQKMGIGVSEDEVYCTSYFVARYISENHPEERVMVIGESGLFEELKKAGVETVKKNCDIVTIGLDREFSYQKLADALRELNEGAILVSSNHDYTFPVENGMMPGTGSLVAAVEAASGKRAYVVGKPNTYGFDLIKKENRLRKNEVIIVGDRLDTDITFAKKCGIKSALVLTGVTKKEDIKKIKPDYVFDSIVEFSLP